MTFSWIHLSLLTFVLGVSAASDVAWRRIPNQLTVSLAVAGVAASAVTFGATGMVHSLAAAAVMAVVLGVPWKIGKLGGGDVKIGIAAAAWVGWPDLGPYIVWSGLFAGVLSIAAYLASGREARLQIQSNLASVATGGAMSPPLRGSVSRVPVPAGMALGAGALTAILLRG